MSDASDSNPSPSAVDFSGRQIGDFRLLRRLGRGAMADVYLAEQRRLKRSVALKVLKPELAGDRTYLQRFELEAQAAASLIHANIVQIYEVGCVGGLHYIAQEYVRGQNLREYISRNGPPDLLHALSIMRQVAAALAKASEQGIVHRDIKPENIMLTAGGEVKVADFGLARRTREDDGNDLTQVGVTLGTPLYMSPEQVEGKTLDPRSDLYSFGVTCYHMLSGSPPFSGETALGVAVQHLKKQPVALETLRNDLPPSLCRIVHRMLAKDPSHRFTSARDLLRELRRVQLDHFGDDWPEDLPGWDLPTSDTTVDFGLAATQQLADLMHASAVASRPHRVAWFVLAMFVAFAVGGTVAWRTTSPTWLLANAEASPPPIEKKATVLAQWYQASQINTEEAWQSVIDFFPSKKYFVLRAKQQLALIYLLRKENYDRAMAIFEDLSNLGDEEPELQAFGLAGQCGVLSLRGRYRESDTIFVNKLWPIHDKLANRAMRELVDHAVRKNRAELGGETSREWDKWFEDLSRETP
ncbi:MAG: serine/threonine-protein kinase [Thermoguttaceae bacterium]